MWLVLSAQYMGSHDPGLEPEFLRVYGAEMAGTAEIFIHKA